MASLTIGSVMTGVGKMRPSIVECPVLVHPLVQRVHHHVRRPGVHGQPLFEQAGERRPHERAVDAELVHQREARLGREERLGRADGITHEFTPGLALRVAVLEELLGGPGATHDVEGGVRDVLRDDIADCDLRPAVDLDVLDQPGVLGREELGEGVRLLVHVVVGVEDGKIDNGIWHGQPPENWIASFQLRRQYYGRGEDRANRAACSAWQRFSRSAKLCMT